MNKLEISIGLISLISAIISAFASVYSYKQAKISVDAKEKILKNIKNSGIKQSTNGTGSNNFFAGNNLNISEDEYANNKRR